MASRVCACLLPFLPYISHTDSQSHLTFPFLPYFTTTPSLFQYQSHEHPLPTLPGVGVLTVSEAILPLAKVLT